jgi:hypothetical protein
MLSVEKHPFRKLTRRLPGSGGHSLELGGCHIRFKKVAIANERKWE